MAYKTKKFSSDFESSVKEDVVQDVQDLSPAEPVDEQVKSVQKKSIDKEGILRCLAYNKWVQTPEEDLMPVVEKMLTEGADYLLNVRWFLAYSERESLLSEIKSKFEIL